MQFVVFDLLVQSIPIDPQSRRRFGLNALTNLQHLLNEFAFDKRNNLVVQICRIFPSFNHPSCY